MSQKVFVTGASGFLAGHVVELLLKRGYSVVGSVRSLNNEKKYEHLKQILPEKQQNLTIVQGDLSDNKCWVENLKGCDYLIHTASPFMLDVPKDPENEFIKPAVEGTEAIVKAAIQNGVKKIVLTSSMAAIYPGHEKLFFTEEDWSNLSNIGPYEKSKHLAEKKAWEIINENLKNGGKTVMTSINPSFIQGPAHSKNNTFVSSDVVQQLMTNKLPGIAKVSSGYVDARDCALAHINALDREITNGKRYSLVANTFWLEDVANMLREEFSQYGYQITSRNIANVVISVSSLFSNKAALIKNRLGKFIQFDNSASQQDLGIQYRSVRETMLDTVYDMIQKEKIPNMLPQGHQQTHKKTKFQYE